MRISLRELILLAACVCLACGWYAERRVHHRETLGLRIGAERFEERLAAIEEIKEGKVEPTHVIYLLYALTDPDPQVQKAADEAIKNIGGTPQNDAPHRYSKGYDRYLATWLEWYLSQE